MILQTERLRTGVPGEDDTPTVSPTPTPTLGPNELPDPNITEPEIPGITDGEPEFIRSWIILLSRLQEPVRKKILCFLVSSAKAKLTGDGSS